MGGTADMVGVNAVSIEAMQPGHWDAVRAIYLEGIATGNATFETDAPAWAVWDQHHHSHSRLVAVIDDQVVGWAALSPVSSRCVYAGVAEESIYITASVRGQGVGKTLLNALIASSEKHDIWTLQTGIFPENVASLGLHKACGFREIGCREHIGQLHGVWRDTVLLERRSKVVGV
jgi:phosphinothricin acetyltransferase